MSTSISNFYDKIEFPGRYTYEILGKYGEVIQNPYLRTIDEQLGNGLTVLDAGCGTGLTTNLFSMRHTGSQFTGIDFAKSIEFADEFAKTNNIQNVRYIKSDLVNIELTDQYNVVICQGVLHHIPEYSMVIKKLTDAVVPGGKLVLGLYHPAGKIAKRYINIDYGSQTLNDDQEINPFELAFTAKQVQQLVPGFALITAHPRLLNNITIPSFFNYKNGGLVTYVFKKSQ